MKRPGRLPALRADGISVQVISEHRLAEPDQYLAPVHDLAGTVRFDHDHKVEFAGPGPGAAVGYQDWQAWAEQHPGRGLGRIGPEVLAGLGVGAGGLSAAVRRRRRTAWALAGLDEAALRSRVEQHTGAQQGGVAAPVGAGAWRTRLASPAGSGGAVHSWAGPEDDPLPGARRAEAVRLPAADRQTSGLVPRIGPPESERDPGSGAS